MNIVTKADGSLLKVGTSLATSTTCCCCNPAIPATCNCLPSTFLITFPAWTYTRPVGVVAAGTYSLAAQTVLAYKCCFSVDYPPLQNYMTYRINSINIGTTTWSGCTTNVYLNLWIAYPSIAVPGTWSCSVESRIYFSFSFPDSDTLPNCDLCSTPRTITTPTSCDGITNDFLCGLGNSYFWGNTRNCDSCERGTYDDLIGSVYPKLNNVCQAPSNLTFQIINGSGSPNPLILTAT